MSEQKLPRGAYLFREGESAQYAYILIDGILEIVKTSLDGETVLAEVSAKKEIFGEMALIDGAPRSAGARAKTDVVVTQVDKTAFLKYVSSNPQAAHNIMVKLSKELRDANKTVGELKANEHESNVDHSEDFPIELQQAHSDVDDTDAIYDSPPSRPLTYAAGIILSLFLVAILYT